VCVWLQNFKKCTNITQNVTLISGKLQKYCNKNHFNLKRTNLVFVAKEALKFFSSNLFATFLNQNQRQILHFFHIEIC
jgi:hypothetical protein